MSSDATLPLIQDNWTRQPFQVEGHPPNSVVVKKIFGNPECMIQFIGDIKGNVLFETNFIAKNISDILKITKSDQYDDFIAEKCDCWLSSPYLRLRGFSHVKAVIDYLKQESVLAAKDVIDVELACEKGDWMKAQNITVADIEPAPLAQEKELKSTEMENDSSGWTHQFSVIEDHFKKPSN